MNEVVIDIIFAGMLLIPLVLNSSKTLVNICANSYLKTLSQSKHFILSLPISVYLIYNISDAPNWAGLIAAYVGFVVFFYFYACAVSFLIKQVSTYKVFKQS